MASTNGKNHTWQEACVQKKAQQTALLPKEWLLPKTLVPSTQLNVIDVPRSCGLLSKQELAITDTEDVDQILKKLSSGQWSAVDVTKAYCKRATIAQQLVRQIIVQLKSDLLIRKYRQTA